MLKSDYKPFETNAGKDGAKIELYQSIKKKFPVWVEISAISRARREYLAPLSRLFTMRPRCVANGTHTRGESTGVGVRTGILVRFARENVPHS